MTSTLHGLRIDALSFDASLIGTGSADRFPIFGVDHLEHSLEQFASLVTR